MVRRIICKKLPGANQRTSGVESRARGFIVTSFDDPQSLKRQAGEIQAEWYLPPSPELPRGWLVYSLDFILATLQGYFTEPQNISHAAGWMILGSIVQVFMALAQAILMLLAWLPITGTILEITARVF